MTQGHDGQNCPWRRTRCSNPMRFLLLLWDLSELPSWLSGTETKAYELFFPNPFVESTESYMIGYCSCKFCCSPSVVRQWRFAYKLLSIKRSSGNVCANLKYFPTWRTQCSNTRIKEELSIIRLHLFSYSIFYVVCDMCAWCSPCHVLIAIFLCASEHHG